IAQIELCGGRTDEIGVALRLEPTPDRGTGETPMPGDIDTIVLVHGYPRPAHAHLGALLNASNRETAMPAPEILVVLPTLGDRLETLEQTLRSVDEQRQDVDLTLVVIAPPGATEGRALAARHGAVVVDDLKQGISAAINRGL